MDKIDLPLGFDMALAQNELAMKQFEALSESEKAEIINKSHSVNSKQEMQNLVNSLFNNSGSI